MARTEIPLIALHPETGDYVEGAEVTIYDRATGSESTSIYTTETGSTESTQPLLTDDQGRITAWADRGRYRIEYTVDALPTTIEYYDSVPGEDESIDTNFLADNSVTATKIATNAVGNSELASGAVASDEIASNAVTNAKINDGSVTVNKIASDAVDASKLRDDISVDSNRAVTTNHIRDAAITNAKIADETIAYQKLATGAANSAQGKVALQWLSSGIRATELSLTSAYQTVVSISSVPSGVYLAIPRFTVNFRYSGASRVLTARISGPLAPGEDTIVQWAPEQGGAEGGANVNMTRVIWVTTPVTVSLQAKVQTTSIDIIEANTANMDLIRIN